ncbi:hypothetical protein Gotri_026541, partial [Gossypium trilobum]|nr:hypothetical protein [Gossypium trilobum]
KCHIIKKGIIVNQVTIGKGSLIPNLNHCLHERKNYASKWVQCLGKDLLKQRRVCMNMTKCLSGMIRPA